MGMTGASGGHEFDAAFTAKDLPAAKTGVRRFLTLLTNFNTVVRGTDCEFPAARPGTPVALSAQGKLPATYVFRTREGGRGLLQITGFADRPPGLKVRYKLVSWC
jgi:hypothetical protein